jgi:MFS family permease
MYAVSYLDRQLISLLVEPLRKSLHIDDFQVSLLQGAAFSVFYALFGLPLGWLADRFSKRWVLFGGMTFWSLAAASCGLARSATTLAIARFGVGAGEAALVPVAYSTIARIFPPGRVSLGIAIFTLGSSIGSALALIIGGLVIAAAIRHGPMLLPVIGLVEPWQFVFIVTGLPGILIALLAFTVPREPKREKVSAAVTGPGLGAYLRSRWIYLTLNITALALAAVMAFAVGAWAPTFLMRTYHVDVARAGLLIGVFHGVGGVIGLVVAGLLADRMMRKGRSDGHMRPLLWVLPLVMLLAIFAFIVAPGAALSAAMTGTMMGMTSTGNPIASHLQLSTPPEYRARIAAITVMVQQLAGMSIGPTLVAVITQYGFGDPDMLRYAMATSVLMLAPVAMLCLALGLRHARAAMQAAHPESIVIK